MVDDWENITKNLQLVHLPSAKPAGVILDEYFESEKSKRRPGSAEADILEEVVSGLKEYFNRSLGRILLYRFERDQFYDIHEGIEDPTSDLAGKTFADIYGGEHLLRLFGKCDPNFFGRWAGLDDLANLTDSKHARTPCPDQHGQPVSQPPERRTYKFARLALERC